MILHYLKSKENKEKELAYKLYKRIVILSNKIVNSNNYFIKKDFKTTFEIFSIFLILYIKNIRDLKVKNFKSLNQELIDMFINDLDYSLREKGIGDMSIGKYVKSYVKKFYFRLSSLDITIVENKTNNLLIFLEKLDFIKKENLNEFSQLILDNFNKIQIEIKNTNFI